MKDEKSYSELANKIMKGIKLAQKKMIHEKALRGDSVIISDKDGRIINIPARELEGKD